LREKGGDRKANTGFCSYSNGDRSRGGKRKKMLGRSCHVKLNMGQTGRSAGKLLAVGKKEKALKPLVSRVRRVGEAKEARGEAVS